MYIHPVEVGMDGSSGLEVCAGEIGYIKLHISGPRRSDSLYNFCFTSCNSAL